MKVENLINVECFSEAAWLLLSVIKKLVKTVSSRYNPRGNRYNLSFFKGVVLTTRFVHERGRKRTIRIKLTLGIRVCRRERGASTTRTRRAFPVFQSSSGAASILFREMWVGKSIFSCNPCIPVNLPRLYELLIASFILLTTPQLAGLRIAVTRVLALEYTPGDYECYPFKCNLFTSNDRVLSCFPP